MQYNMKQTYNSETLPKEKVLKIKIKKKKRDINKKKKYRKKIYDINH